MNRPTQLLIGQIGISILFFLSIAASLPAQEPEPNSEPANFADALQQGQATVSLRYRYENVSDDAVGDREAHASTLRTALAFSSRPFKGVSFTVEAENVAEIGNDLYNNAGFGDLSNEVRDRPVVADPADTELNQAYLAIERGDTRVTVGRRELNLGDVRFVGNVGWRQNHQAFHAVSITNESLSRVEWTYAYLDKVHRINGSSLSMSSHCLLVAVDVEGLGTLTSYAYLLDYDDAVGLSTDTFGLELKGERAVGKAKLLYELEVADQSDAGDNPSRIEAGYLHALVGGKFRGVTAKLAVEVLDGSARDGQFQTPLSTLHKWNGWADKFLRTPTEGLEDLYLALSGQVAQIAWTAVFHDFSAQTGNADYGQEIDLQLTYRAPWQQVFGFKAAIYDADQHAADTDKLMLWTSYRF